MPLSLFDHVDLRVRSFAAARPFYDAFLPAVGFTEISVHPREISYSMPVTPERPKPPFIGLNQDEPDHRGGANRFAFWADGEAEVDRVAGIVRAAGARAVEGPEYCFDYTPGYYAVFFEDVDGNKWEVCCRNVPVRPKPDA